MKEETRKIEEWKQSHFRPLLLFQAPCLHPQIGKFLTPLGRFMHELHGCVTSWGWVQVVLGT